MKHKLQTNKKKRNRFMATYFASKRSSQSWFIDSGYTNHKTHDEQIFRELDRSVISKVRIGKGDHLNTKRKRHNVN